MSDMLMKNFLAATGLGSEDTMYLLKPLQGLLRKLVLHAVLLDIVDPVAERPPQTAVSTRAS